MTILAKRYKSRQTKMRAKSMLSTAMVETMQNEETVITRFLNDKDVPSWFRGQSQFQLEAADALLNAIRDDTEQRTSHRVRHCLDVIGLEPKISSYQVKQLMRLSRGNDLAFLWFTMDLCYKTKGPEFSVNEQLIMSSIAHLDMITTLRELDRILPPSSLSKRRWDRRQQLAAKEAARRRMDERRIKRAAAAEEQKKLLPYFHKMVRPRQFGHSLTVPMPDLIMNFGVYELYNDPDYKPPNEFNRWYESYQLNPGQRIINRILNDTMDDIFDDYDFYATKAHKNEMLCEHHKVIREMEQTLEAELVVLAREKCLDYINPENRRRQERIARITKELDCEVKRFLYRFRVMANKSKKKMLLMSISSDDTCQYREFDKSEIGWLDELEGEEGKCVDMEGVEYASTTQRSSGDKQGNNETNARQKQAGSGDCMGGGNSGSSNESYQNFTQRRNSKARVSITEALVSMPQSFQTRKSGNNYDCPCPPVNLPLKPPSSTSTNTYFEANTEHKPYVFHYKRIFTFKEEPCENKRLQQSIVRALLSDADLRKYAQTSKMNVSQAVMDCVDKQWVEGVRAKNAELREIAKAEEEADRNMPPELRGRLSYDREYFDPDDKPFMEKMLNDAIEEMKKNPKFVLAALPNAYKLPLLREWIYRRYGKHYTRDELTKSFRKSLKIFKALEKITLQVRLPTTKQLGESFFVDYSCRNYLLKKSNFIKADYYRRLNASIMEQARVFWFAMRPYACSNGPPRNTYYAYMPAGVKDILHFRIWKPNEFMNARSQWEKRQRLNRRKRQN